MGSSKKMYKSNIKYFAYLRLLIKMLKREWKTKKNREFIKNMDAKHLMDKMHCAPLATMDHYDTLNHNGIICVCVCVYVGGGYEYVVIKNEN